MPAFGLGCAAHGATAADAVQEAREAALSMLEIIADEGKAAPPPDATTDYSGQVRLRMPRSLHANMARMANAEGVSLNQMMVSLLSARASSLARHEWPVAQRMSLEEILDTLRRADTIFARVSDPARSRVLKIALLYDDAAAQLEKLAKDGVAGFLAPALKAEDDKLVAYLGPNL